NNQKANFEKALNLNNLLRKNLSNIENVVINSPNVTKTSKNDFEKNTQIFCSPYILSASILGLNAETIQNMLSKKEIYVGLGSACSAKKSGNRVLESMNKSKPEILGNIRISISKNTTQQEILCFCDELYTCIKTLREKL
ncbi:MAG: hypothetical protein ACI4TI_01085, partial [Christensenellales bacterium]